MIDAEMRNAVVKLHEEGMPLREISRRLKISRNTIRRIVRRQGMMPETVRQDKIQIDPDVLRRLYRECDGWIQRVHEKLVEEEDISLAYSTLTRIIRELGLGQPQPARCGRVPDEPGAEMQHDTTVYRVNLGGQRTKVIASLQYLRYSKRRYLKFYRVFNRFAMKCFLHEALMHWGCAARQCIIDNTNLARLRGTGREAVIVPEMRCFAERYGFEFLCHAIRHSNRKAGEERSFWTVETNFLPGRRFESLEDLNRQAYQWSTVRMEHRAASKTGVIPAKAFEHERGYLTQLPPHLPAPYCEHQRQTDSYGYISFDGNYYWVPGSKREKMKVLQFADRLKIYQRRSCVAEYALAPDGVKNERYSPPGQPKPRHLPKNRKRGSQQEEKRLRGMGPDVAAYVDYVLRTPGIQRHRFLRELLSLSLQVTRGVFVETLQRALRYRVLHMETLQRIAWFCMSQGEGDSFGVDVDESYRHRAAYQEGYLTDEPDLAIYEDPPSEGEQSAAEDEQGDHQEKDRQEKDRQEKDRQEKDRQEKDRQEKDRQEKDRQEKDRQGGDRQGGDQQEGDQKEGDQKERNSEERDRDDG